MSHKRSPKNAVRWYMHTYVTAVCDICKHTHFDLVFARSSAFPIATAGVPASFPVTGPHCSTTAIARSDAKLDPDRSGFSFKNASRRPNSSVWML